MVFSQGQNKKVINVAGKKFTLKYENGKFQSLTNSNNDTIIKGKYDFEDVTVIDFNKDGYKDVWIEYFSNAAGEGLLYLFDKNQKTFKPLLGEKYSNPEYINANYFYSYYRAGCADSNWGSDLFKIVNLKAIKLATITGNGCGDEFDGIFIYKLLGNKKILKQKFPIKKLNNYNDTKWGFIKSYWTKNYSKFIN